MLYISEPQRSANTGWGSKDAISRWDHDKYEGPKDNRKSAYGSSDRIAGSQVDERGSKLRPDIQDGRFSAKANEEDRNSKQILKDHDRGGFEKQPERQGKEPNSREGRERKMNAKRSGRYDSEPNPKDDRDWRESEKRSRHDEDKSQKYPKEEKQGRGNEKWSGRYETEESQKEERSQRSEKYSRYDRDETEHNLKEDRDRGRSEKRSRYDVDVAEPNLKEDRPSEKRSRYSSSSHDKGKEDESPRRRVRR